MKKENKLIKFEYITKKDVDGKINEIIVNLKNYKKSKFKFNGEDLYEIDCGHDFVFGFFEKYITKSKIIAIKYFGFWNINGKDFEFKKNRFVKIKSKKSKKTKISDISFPIVKNIKSKTISENLKQIKPIK